MYSRYCGLRLPTKRSTKINIDFQLQRPYSIRQVSPLVLLLSFGLLGDIGELSLLPGSNKRLLFPHHHHHQIIKD